MAAPNGRPASRPGFLPGAGASCSTPRWRSARRWRCSCTRTRSPASLVVQEPQHDPAQRRDPAGLLLRAGPARPARLRGHRGRHAADRPRRRGQPAAGHPAAVRGHVPGLVRRRRLRGDRASARWCPRRSCRSRRPTCSPATSTRSTSSRTPPPTQEAKVSKLVSLVVKAVALIFVLTLDKQNAINLQLLGGIWILQTLPAVVFGLYTRWFHRWACWPAGRSAMVYGTVEAYQVVNPATGKHFGGSLALIPGRSSSGLHRDDRLRAQPGGRGRALRDPERREGLQRQTRRSRPTTSPTLDDPGHRRLLWEPSRGRQMLDRVMLWWTLPCGLLRQENETIGGGADFGP